VRGGEPEGPGQPVVLEGAHDPGRKPQGPGLQEDVLAGVAGFLPLQYLLDVVSFLSKHAIVLLQLRPALIAGRVSA